MASMFKQLLASDKATVRTPLYEGIPMTGTLFNGTDYAGFPDEENIKKYSHGIFESVYDYPYLSSSANHLFDLSFGFASSSIYNTTGVVDADKKINMYNQMCQMLMGFDDDGKVKPLKNPETGAEMKEVFLIDLSRLVYKDEIKKGSVNLYYFDDTSYSTSCDSGEICHGYEAGSIYIDSPVGEYSSIYVTISPEDNCGMVFYQAGAILLSGSSWAIEEANGSADTFADLFTSGSIEEICDGFRHRICNLQLTNTTELFSQMYFCRANNNEFNYSSNPTYLSSSQIVTKDVASDPAVSYLTGVGLFSAKGELLATAKLSEPLKKTSSTELNIKIRLDW